METRCLNCDTVYTGNFCPQCGQKHTVHRFSFAAFLHEIPHSVFHVDKGFLFTFIQLLYRPGSAISEFIKGKRVRYFTPLAYLLLMCTIRTLLDHGIASYKQQHFVMNPQILFPKVAMFFYHYPALMLCVVAPFLSLWSWLFNRASGYNYWENLVMNIYVAAQFNIFFILTRLLYLLTDIELVNATPMLTCFIFYLGFTYATFFPRRKGAGPLLQRFLMYLCIIPTFLTILTLTGFMTQWWRWW